MSFTVLQDTPTVIDLVSHAKSRGWTIGTGYADHEACNFGDLQVVDSLVTVETGKPYTISYKISNYASGNIVLRVGTASGITRTANGNYTETITATGSNPKVVFYSTGALRVEVIDVVPATIDVSSQKRNTIVFSEKSGKWATFLSFTSDYGISLFKDLFTFKKGKMYRHDPNITPRNNIYGVQYNTIINVPFNAGKGQPKTYESLTYESNMLMVSTSDGIKTSLGQVSDLVAGDFLKETLDDGIVQVNIYSEEGIFVASFAPSDNNRVDGSSLKGTYITVELVTTETGILNLKNVMVNSVPSYIGGR